LKERHASSTVSFSGAGYAIALGSASSKSMIYGTGMSDMGFAAD